MKIKRNLALSDSGFVFNPSTGDSFSVNPIGLEIIRYLKDGHDKEDIVTLMTKKYNVEEGALQKDLRDFFDTLNHLKLTQPE